MQQIKTDLCVIGAGSGGLSVAAGAVQMGARVVLIEAGEMGGDCLNAGCVPSKALIAAAAAAEAQRKGFRGVAGVAPVVDFAAVKDHVAAVIAAIEPHDSQARFEGLGCTVIRAQARFTGPQEVEAGTARITARRFVIATGSRPFVPPIPGLETVPFHTNETIFALRDRPDHLLIIGGGPIGLEMAQAHRRLGCAVTVVEAAQALGREDPEAAAVVLASLRAEGVEIREGVGVAAVEGQAGAITLRLADGARLTGSHLLVAVGRKVAVAGLGLEAAGVEFDAKGVKVDARLRSVSNRKVFAVGDAAGGLQFTHVAGYHAGIVVRQAVLGLPAKTRTDHIPRATYTDPELAQVGLTEAEARAVHGAKLTVVRAGFDGNDRAVAGARGKGFVKVMVVGGRPVGALIVGPAAGELIGIWALALAARLKLTALAGTVLPYPTLSEASKRAASAYFSPKLFDNPVLKAVVRFVQRVLP
ncbi:dihydrolipoyl dehydrogenase family protein [Fuscovulum blasticum]|uniref:dihydrolipoyl dehydrogenase family protein n=1 Tax=Fuscovulum blasticum TaxID=1075 RepID=UPI000D3E61DB|nr:FAD-dependent oxidoreductase [Fuscovulum blasticum]AWD23385.1 dihydrolipoamide dehydrogenase [Fuscovulum blasticum]